ncbi:14870_t:CDS:2 [Funneliformis caledonium]|uniref:14870_t:CDS:1 n=1 Tax=Funneliformis caledonium TaxID=1117310 RepID=A0A9N9A3B3_9GLOM|nr:14870_t:CDS:2 [Funneliformis caledonium]
MFCDAAPFIELTNNNNDEEEYIFRDVLGSKFEGYNGIFLPINTLIEIELRTKFYSMEIVMVLVEKGYLSVIWEEDMLKNIQDRY